MSLKGESDFFSTVSTAISCAAAQLREGRPALAAFLQHLPVLEMPDVGHRLLRHALDLALLLARAVGLDREDAVRLGAQAHVLQDPGGEGLVAELAQLAHHLDGLGALRFASACSSKICTITESVSVKSSLIFGKSLLMWR